MQEAAPFKVNGISPDAVRPLVPQVNDGREVLLPLHAASVLSWLCGDTSVRSALQQDRATCNRELGESVSTCIGELQGVSPVGRSRATARGRLGVVEFRQEVRQCAEADYSRKQLESGKPVPALDTDAADPLSPAMGGK
jgi:hypothetical protein